jgi:hypothetical protein
LAERFAYGEIDKAEFEERRQVLAGVREESNLAAGSQTGCCRSTQRLRYAMRWLTHYQLGSQRPLSRYSHAAGRLYRLLSEIM